MKFKLTQSDNGYLYYIKDKDDFIVFVSMFYSNAILELAKRNKDNY